MSIKNRLTDLNDHLFEMLERLNDDDLTGDKLKQEVSRAGAMVSVSKAIIDNAAITLKSFEIIGGDKSLVRDRIGAQKCLS